MNPDDYTIQELMLDVGDGHQLYVHDWGNKQAKQPIIFLHGGPGSGVKDRYKQNYDPQRHRVVFFDQRGSGKSLPYGSLEQNTTQDLVEDIEKIAIKLKLNTFMLNGGSWGSCLALAYALKYPKRVHSMILRGIFTGSKAEIDWLKNGLFAQFFPDVYAQFLQATPAEHLTDAADYHFKRILGNDWQASTESAIAVGNLESALLSLDDRHIPLTFSEDYDPTFVRIETHYMANNCFMEDRYILENAHKLTMPIWLIQGRYDMVCPPSTAYELHKKIKTSQLIWTLAGHGNDRSTYDVDRTLLLQLPEK
jgi:proline iminopeptidase